MYDGEKKTKFVLILVSFQFLNIMLKRWGQASQAQPAMYLKHNQKQQSQKSAFLCHYLMNRNKILDILNWTLISVQSKTDLYFLGLNSVLFGCVLNLQSRTWAFFFNSIWDLQLKFETCFNLATISYEIKSPLKPINISNH